MGEITELTEEEKAADAKPQANKANLEGAPELPPQLKDFAGKSSDQIIEELNNNPFLMDQEHYDAQKDDGSNAALEALKAMKEEGTPTERAEEYKSQGNVCYKRKQYREALDAYTNGIDIECGDKYTEAALYLNRAACNLALKNYRRCINDCNECLKRQTKNVKACYRSATAMFELNLFDEAEKTLLYAQQCDDKNPAVNNLLKKVQAKKQQIQDVQDKKKRAAEAEVTKKQNLKKALKMRGILNLKTREPVDTPDNSKVHLEDPMDVESQLIIPMTVVYPTTEEFDFVSEVSELNTPMELLQMVLAGRPESFYEDGRHENFKPKKLECYLETVSGGLCKAGKKVPIGTALTQGHAPLLDGLIRMYVVPKVDSPNWISTWNKQEAMNKRQTSL